MSSSPKQFNFTQLPNEETNSNSNLNDENASQLAAESADDIRTSHEYVDFLDVSNNTHTSLPSILPQEEINSNKLNNKKSILQPKKKRSWGKIFSLTIISICILFTAFGGFLMWRSGTSLGGIFVDGGGIDIGQLITGQRSPLQGESEGRTNILLIGKDDEANLTDTMIIASYYHKEAKMTTVSLPRDFLINDGYSTGKINAVMAYADQRYTAGQTSVLPERFLSDLIGRETGIAIHYWTTINFNGVEQLVNTLGGIDVNVENTFTDCQYPNKSYGYIKPCPRFTKGVTAMDGATALIFSRSRYSFDNPAESIKTIT